MLKLGSKGRDVERMQTLLNALLKPSPRLRVDGDFGKKSHHALIRFQQSRRLKTDAEVGPQTWQALGQKPEPIASVISVRTATPARFWMTIAETEVGVRENAAAGQHNQRILEFHKTTLLRATEDEIPWCSSFVNWVMVESGRTGTKSAAAKSWLNWVQSSRNHALERLPSSRRGSAAQIKRPARVQDFTWRSASVQARLMSACLAAIRAIQSNTPTSR